MKSGEINSLFKNFSKVIKNPKSDLKYKNKFTLLISVVLSAQCTDVNVNNVTKNIYPKYNKPEHFVKLGRKKIEKLIKSIGLFRNKGKSVYLLSKQLIEKHNGKVPKNFDDLYALPGVGKKTASVVLNEGFGLPTIAVDTHVFRVSNRTGLAYGKNPDKVQENLYKAAKQLIIKAKKFEKKDKLEKALKLYSKAYDKLLKAYDKDKKNPDILNYLGFTLRKAGNFEEAEKFYLEGLEIKPDHEGINEYLGELYVKTNRVELAKERLEVLKGCKCEEFEELKELIDKN